MSAFTPHQRDLLMHRIARAIRWRSSTIADRDYATNLAGHIVTELEMSFFSAAAQRRAIEKVVENLEQSA